MPNLIIGSRGSKLALWQANWVKSELERLHEGLTVEIEIIKTTGDKLTEASLSRMPGKGVFTKEIEEALFERRIDLAVHSLKDLPTTLPEGLHLAAITKREDPRDALLVNRRLASRVNSIATLPVQPKIGTSSPRRAAQLKLLRPDVQIFELRGNVETRLRKLDEGEFDAIILAAAGLIRLGYGSRITQLIPTSQLLPAVSQGALGIETCVEDERTNYLLEGLNHWPTRNAVEAERAVLRGLGGGCAVPIAAFGQVENSSDGNLLRLEALVCNVTGTKIVRHDVTGSQYKSDELGSLLARHLIAAGAYELLNDDPGTQGVAPGSPPPAIPFSPPTSLTGEAKSSASAVPALRPDPMPENEPSEIQSFGGQLSSAVDIEFQPVEKYSNSVLTVAPESPELIQKSEAAEYLRFEIETQVAEKLNGVRAYTIEIEEEEEAASTSLEADKPPPLSGKRILVTRARNQADTLVHTLKGLGAEVIICPTIEIRQPDNWFALDQAINDLRNYNWLVFTSSNGVNFFLRRFDELQHGRAELAGLKICAVGKKTAEKLAEEKLQVDLTPEKFSAENLVSAFIKKYGVGQRIRGTKMLLPAAKSTRDVIRPSLEKLGVTVDVVEAYQNVLPDRMGEEIVSLINQAEAEYVIFTSPSTVNNLALLLDSDNLSAYLAKTRIACIGPVTAKAAEQCGLTVNLQPDEHTVPAIVEEIIKDCQP